MPKWVFLQRNNCTVHYKFVRLALFANQAFRAVFLPNLITIYIYIRVSKEFYFRKNPKKVKLNFDLFLMIPPICNQ